MRTTLSLDDDVAVLLKQVQASREATFKQVVNDALRRGLEQLSRRAVANKPFRTGAVHLGECYFPSLDKVPEVLAEAEGEDFR